MQTSDQGPHYTVVSMKNRNLDYHSESQNIGKGRIVLNDAAIRFIKHFAGIYNIDYNKSFASRRHKLCLLKRLRVSYCVS